MLGFSDIGSNIGPDGKDLRQFLAAPYALERGQKLLGRGIEREEEKKKPTQKGR